MIVTIDTGTTNTRVKVWNGIRVAGQAQKPVGVRDTAITGSKDKLVKGVRDTLNEALEKAGIGLGEVERIIASGMITSNLGLVEIPHTMSPVSIEDLAGKMIEITMPEICKKAICFIPGVKNAVSAPDLDSFEQMDIMRGEEVEVFGLLDRLRQTGPCLMVMPGSHCKFVQVNERNQIAGSLTTLTGELLDVINKHTILSSSLDQRFADELIPEMVQMGGAYAKRLGLTRSGFLVRLLEQSNLASRDERASFLIGAVCQNDLTALKNSHALKVYPESKILIGGNPQMAGAYHILFQSDRDFSGEILLAGKEVVEDLSGYGALMVAKKSPLFLQGQKAN